MPRGIRSYATNSPHVSADAEPAERVRGVVGPRYPGFIPYRKLWQHARISRQRADAILKRLGIVKKAHGRLLLPLADVKRFLREAYAAHGARFERRRDPRVVLKGDPDAVKG